MTVNGSQQTVNCEKTAVNEWKWVTVNASLKASTNSLIITNTGGLPMYIDQVCYRPADVAPMTYFVDIKQAEQGTIVADKTEAAEGDTITLTINANEGYALEELRVVNSVFYTMERTIDISQLSAVNHQVSTITFVMPGDNVTLQPKFKDASSVMKLDFSNVIAGAIPEGWRCVQEGNEVHAYPSTYSLGARTMAGFTGYQGKALYWREEYAEYGSQNEFPLTLEPGDYELTFAMAAWKGTPKYKVSVLEAATGSVIATSEAFTAAPNADGSTAANVASATQRNLAFTVGTTGNSIIRFTNESRSSGYDEYLLLSCNLRRIGGPASIKLVNVDATESPAVFGIGGERRRSLSRGINIIRTPDGKTRKMIIK